MFAAGIASQSLQHGATTKELLSTPVIITVIIVSAILEILLIIGVVHYVFDISINNLRHPSTIGHEKWYHSKLNRTIVGVLGIIAVVAILGICITFVLVFPGPALAEQHATAENRQANRQTEQQLRRQLLARVNTPPIVA